jgi:hypothetical protein
MNIADRPLAEISFKVLWRAGFTRAGCWQTGNWHLPMTDQCLGKTLPQADFLGPIIRLVLRAATCAPVS